MPPTSVKTVKEAPRKKRVTLSEKIAKLNQSETEAAEVLASLQVALQKTPDNENKVLETCNNEENNDDDESSCSELEDRLSDDAIGNIDHGFNCSLCKIVLKNQHEYNLHQKSLRHALFEEMQKGTDFEMLQSEKNKISGIEFPVQCSICMDMFWHRTSFIIHQREHNDTYPYACVRCHQQFVNRKTFLAHMKKHLGISYMSCDRCEMKFPSNSKLQTHMIAKHGLRDTRARKFKCTECGGRFMTKNAVNLHMRCHTGFRPIKCLDCNKGFHNPAALKSHSRVHSGEKPFQCEKCEYTARTKQLLKRHNRIHVSDRPYQCKECDFSCKLSAGLKRHTTQHTGSRPFKCPYCEYKCSSIENVRKHIKKVKKHCGLHVYACKQCDFSTDEGNEYLLHMKERHFPHLDLKVETAAKLSGIFTSSPTPSQSEQMPSQSVNQYLSNMNSSQSTSSAITYVHDTTINTNLHMNVEKGDIFLSSMAAPYDITKDQPQKQLRETRTNEPFNASSFLPDQSCSTSLLSESPMCEPLQTVADQKSINFNNDELSALVKLSNLQKILIPQSDNNSPLMLVVNSNLNSGFSWEGSN